MAGTAELRIIIKAQDEASKAMSQINAGVGKLGTGMKMLAGAAVAGIGAFAGFEAIKSVLGSTEALAGGVRKLSRETGLATEDASRLIFAFKQTGVGADEASACLGMFSKHLLGMFAAEEGGEAAQDAFAKGLGYIGVTAEDLTDSAGRLTTEGLGKLSDAFVAMPDSMRETALSMLNFGRSGKDMLPFLNLGSKAIAELGAEADRLGLTLSGENVAQIKEYTQAHRMMNQALGGLKLQIGQALMPELTKFANWFVEHQPEMREFVANAIDKVREGLTALWRVLQENRQTLIDAAIGIATLGKAMFEFGSWLIAHKVALVTAILAVGTALMWSSGPVGIAVGILGIGAALGVMGYSLDTEASKAFKASVETDRLSRALAWTKAQSDAYDASPAIQQFYALATAAGVLTDALTSVVTLQSVAFKVTAPAEGPIQQAFGPYRGGTPYTEALAANAAVAKKAAEDTAGAWAGVWPETAAKAAAALTAEQEALLALMKALDASGMSAEQFMRWQIECQNAAAWLTDAALALDMSLEDLVDVWSRSGLAAEEFGRRISELTALKDLQTQAEDAMGAVNGLYDAFNKLYEKPTVEGAAQNLALAQLREQRATLIAGGAEADSRKVKKIDEEIASIQADIDVRRAHQEVDRAWMDVKNATLLLDKDQATMTQALIDGMGPLSTTAADFNTQLFIATWGLQDLTTWFNNLAGGASDAQRAFERYAKSTEGERAALAGASAEQLAILWQGGKAIPSFQYGGIMPYTGLAYLHAGEPVLPAGRQLTAGNRTQTFYGPITVQVTSSGASLEEELERILR